MELKQVQVEHDSIGFEALIHDRSQTVRVVKIIWKMQCLSFENAYLILSIRSFFIHI